MFREIENEFEEALEENSAAYTFSIDQLRTKYKWFKKKWRRIDNQIRFGSGLGAKDTSTPTWYGILNPNFSEAMDDMTSVLSRASDLDNCDSSSFLSQRKSDEDDKSDDAGSISDNSADSSDLDNSHNSVRISESHVASSSGDISSNVDETDKSDKTKKSKVVKGVKRLSAQSPKKTNIKYHPRRNLKPKSQSEAMLQVAKSIENSSALQEKSKDTHLEASLEADRKRDELFLAYREQVEANKRHELLTAQLILQSRSPTTNQPQTRSYPHNVPVSNARNTWNVLDMNAGHDQYGDSYTLHQF